MLYLIYLPSLHPSKITLLPFPSSLFCSTKLYGKQRSIHSGNIEYLRFVTSTLWRLLFSGAWRRTVCNMQRLLGRNLLPTTSPPPPLYFWRMGPRLLFNGGCMGPKKYLKTVGKRAIFGAVDRWALIYCHTAVVVIIFIQIKRLKKTVKHFGPVNKNKYGELNTGLLKQIRF
jgi:hypothetical protein